MEPEKDEARYWREEAERLAKEVEDHMRHASVCAQHFKNKDPWVRESALMDENHYSALLYDKLLKANKEREEFIRELSRANIARTGLTEALAEASVERDTLRENAAVLIEEARRAAEDRFNTIQRLRNSLQEDVAALSRELAEVRERWIAHIRAVGESSAVLLKEIDRLRSVNEGLRVSLVDRETK